MGDRVIPRRFVAEPVKGGEVTVAAVARLYLCDALHGVVDGPLAAVAYEFEAWAVGRNHHHPLIHAPILHTMHDAQHHALGAGLAHHHALVVARRERLVHALDPVARAVGPRS